MKKNKELDALERCDACPVSGFGTDEECIDCPYAEAAIKAFEVMAAELTTDMYEIEKNDDALNDFLRRMEEYEENDFGEY